LSSRATRRFLDERFRAAVRAPHDRTALEPLREKAVLLREYLMSREGRATVAELEPDADLDWLHEVYGTISEVAKEYQTEEFGYELHERPAHWNPGDLWEASESNHPSQREDALVGQAFEELLVDGLSPELVDVEQFFADAEPVDPRIRTALRALPSVAAAGPVAYRLARYGITPLLVVNASQAVATVARRHYRTHRLPREREVVIDYRGASNAPENVGILRRASLCEGVRLATEVAPGVSERLFDWLMGVASRKPLLLDGFRAREVEIGLLIKPIKDRVDLLTAWKTAAPEGSLGRQPL
jgi:hypothetical protein